MRLQPRFAAAHNTLGATLMNLGRAPAGIAALERAVSLNPQLTLARVNLGWAMANHGHLPEAVAQFAHMRGTSTRPSPRSRSSGASRWRCTAT